PRPPLYILSLHDALPICPDDTFGWGVVFSGRTLRNLRAADEVSHAAITRDFQAWDNVDVVHREEKISIHGNSFSGIARIRLLNIDRKSTRLNSSHVAISY